MRAISGILGLVLAVAIIYFVYTSQYGGNKAEPPPNQQIDLTAIRSDLLSLAQAERRYHASSGTYATLEQLQQQGAVHFQGTGRRGYVFAIETGAGPGFRITATPDGPSRTDWPTLSIDDSMQISTSGPPDSK